MQVFNACLKIIRKNLPTLSIYMVAFLSVTMIFQLAHSENSMTDFMASKPKLAVINLDTDAPLTAGLTEYLANNAEIIPVGKDDEAQRDALFFRNVDSILYIPAGFTQQFLSGSNPTIEKRSVPNSAAAIYADLLSDAYLNTARVYAQHTTDDQHAIVANTLNDLSNVAQVTLATYGSPMAEQNEVAPFFNAASYAILSLLILGVTSTLLSFRQTERLQRTQCSPLPSNSIHLQSLLANSLYMLAVWMLMTLCAYAAFGTALLNTVGLLLVLNMFTLCLVGLSLSYLIGTLIKNRSAQAAIANSLSLGMTFLSGGFVPQSLLGENVLAVARFFPSYWYVRANETLGALRILDSSTVLPIVYCFLIQLGFAVAMVCLTLVLSRRIQNAPPLKQAANASA